MGYIDGTIEMNKGRGRMVPKGIEHWVCYIIQTDSQFISRNMYVYSEMKIPVQKAALLISN